MGISNTGSCFLNFIPHSKEVRLIREMSNSKFGAGNDMNKDHVELEDKEILKD